MEIKLTKLTYSKTIIVVTLLIISGFLNSICTAGQHLKFNNAGFLVIDDQPKLLIGDYSSNYACNEDFLKTLAKNGFNFMRTSRRSRNCPDVGENLDLFTKYGLYATVYLHDLLILDKNDSNKKQDLIEIIEKYKDHPALIGWEVQDEILWHIWSKPQIWTTDEQQKQLRTLIEDANKSSSENKNKELNHMLEKANSYNDRGLWLKAEEIYDKLWKEFGKENPSPEMKLSKRDERSQQLLESIQRGSKIIKQIDPRHFIWANHAPRNSLNSLHQLSKAIDIIGCDIYPAPTYRSQEHSDLDNKALSSVGVYTKRMKMAAPGKPIWMALQGFGWRDLETGECVGSQDPNWGRRPNLTELRLMVYDALLNGANAIIFYGSVHSDFLNEDNELRKNILKVTREIRALDSIILAKPSAKMPSVTTGNTEGSVDGPELQIMLRKVDKDWVLIIINTSVYGIPFTVSQLPGSLNGKKLYLLYSDECHDIKNNMFSDGIAKYGVHIYSTSRKFEVE